MATVRPNQKLRTLVAAFKRLGCDVKFTTRPMIINGGHREPFPRRYLYNPANGAMVAITNYSPSDWIPLRVYESWERRLGIDLPPLPAPRVVL